MADEKNDNSAAKELTPEQNKMVEMGILPKPETPEVPTETPEEKIPEVEEPEIPEVADVDWIKITDGKLKSKDDLENIFEERQKYADYEPLKQKYSQLEQEYQKVKNNPYAENETLYKVSKLAEELKRNDYGFLFNIAQSNFKEMSDFDVLKTKELLDNPEIYNGKEHLLDKGLLEQYAINKPEDYDELTDDEKRRIDDKVEINTIKMAKEAKQARQHLMDLQSKYKPEAVDTEALQKQNDDKLKTFVAQWKPTYQSLEKDFTKISINVDDHVFDVPVREEDAALKKQVFEEAAAYLVAQGLEFTDQNIQQLKDVIEDRYISLNKKYIFKKIGEMSRDMTDDIWRKKVNNPSHQRTDTKPADVELTPEQKAIKKLQTS